VANENPKKVDPSLAEINEAERHRAASVMQDPAFLDWARDFRQKFIVNGFLKTMYALYAAPHKASSKKRTTLCQEHRASC
jgi:hypothetical protein